VVRKLEETAMAKTLVRSSTRKGYIGAGIVSASLTDPIGMTLDKWIFQRAQTKDLGT